MKIYCGKKNPGLEDNRLPDHISAWLWSCAFAVLILMGGGCVRSPRPSDMEPATQWEEIPRVGYSIQAGAFKVLDNAIRLTDTLRNQGVEAVYFIDRDGLHKVRFGDFPDWEAADGYARNKKSEGVISEYFIVYPEAYAVRAPERDRKTIRKNLAGDAHRFLGCPYRWGGTVPSGFDCSGLTMTIYRLNGLILPRTAAEQFKHGKKISKRKLKKGDLVFFRTAGGRRISHVGIYIGDDEFIHAPGRGKSVRKASLEEEFYDDAFAGGRTYVK